ncbi:MAG TPA: two-component regulator propeller domain-containing protein [Lacibacter sp.]|nr:two-component regulator propeller domain-containing protein [Lacibacter sp.]HMO87963.1 two-component regulator propeller domain-containing protein [Lacibacter sp.]HMP86076.1 two-component regulator propeller domain-containing protein [Lacibacter sp.]
MRNLLLYGFFFSWCWSISPAQGTAQQVLRYEQLTSDRGLSENVVYAIRQDRRGFIWMGTHHGLNRYDGYSIRKFFAVPGDTTTLSDNTVVSIAEDPDGKFWLGTENGLNHFDPETAQNRRIHLPGRGTQYMVNAVWVVSRDSLLLFSDNYQLFLYLPLTNTWKEIIRPPEAQGLGTFFRLANGQVGLGTLAPAGVWVYDPAANTFRLQRRLPGTSFDLPGAVLSYYPDSRGNHALFTVDRGIYLYNSAGKLLLHRGLTPGMPPVLATEAFVETPGTLWMATRKGLLAYQYATNRLEMVALEGDSRSLRGNKEMMDMIRDRNGDLWIGSFGEGALYCRTGTTPFSSISLDQLTDSRTQRMLYGLYRWPDSVLAAETGYGRFSLIRNQKPVGMVQSADLGLEHILRLTTGRSLAQLTPALRKMTQELFNSGNLFAHFFVLHDPQTILAYNGNLRVYRPDTSFLLFPEYTGCLVEDESVYWVASNKGLLEVHKKDLQLTRHLHDPANPASLGANYVYYVYCDSLKNLWVGTKGGGLNYYNRETGTFTRYTTADGLPDDVIYFILPDGKGNLWLTTNNGISRMQVATGTFTNYSRRDGLLNSEFNRNGGVLASDGRIYFTGTSGIDYFNPAALEQYKSSPRVYLSELLVNGVPRSTNLDRLNYQENNIGISFTANDFSSPEHVYYRYRLSGSDPYVRQQGSNSVAFHALKPGAYRFEVQAGYDNANWSEPAFLTFHIEAPWWQRGWFYALLAGLLLLLLYLFYRNRINQLQRLFTLRNKISRDLHDEVGASLSSIHVYSSVAEKAMGIDTTKAREALQHISNNTRSVMETMSDIVWAMNTGSVHETTLEAKIKNYGYDLLAPLEIRCRYEIAPEAEKKLVHLGLRRNLLLIIKEALHNIAKYSGATEAVVSLQVQAAALVLQVQDNGKGFIPEQMRTGNGLLNMRQRAAELGGTCAVETAPGSGTTITCRIPLATISD